MLCSGVVRAQPPRLRCMGRCLHGRGAWARRSHAQARGQARALFDGWLVCTTGEQAARAWRARAPAWTRRSAAPHHQHSRSRRRHKEHTHGSKQHTERGHTHHGTAPTGSSGSCARSRPPSRSREAPRRAGEEHSGGPRVFPGNVQESEKRGAQQEINVTTIDLP